jgi:hypothetical protein
MVQLGAEIVANYLNVFTYFFKQRILRKLACLNRMADRWQHLVRKFISKLINAIGEFFDMKGS